jgi:hypothetical protein
VGKGFYCRFGPDDDTSENNSHTGKTNATRYVNIGKGRWTRSIQKLNPDKALLKRLFFTEQPACETSVSPAAAPDLPAGTTAAMCERIDLSGEKIDLRDGTIVPQAKRTGLSVETKNLPVEKTILSAEKTDLSAETRGLTLETTAASAERTVPLDATKDLPPEKLGTMGETTDSPAERKEQNVE